MIALDKHKYESSEYYFYIIFFFIILHCFLLEYSISIDFIFLLNYLLKIKRLSEIGNSKNAFELEKRARLAEARVNLMENELKSLREESVESRKKLQVNYYILYEIVN